MLVNKNIVLHLSLISDIGSATIKKVLSGVNHSQLYDLYHFTQQDFIRFGLPESKALLLVQGLQDKSILDEELQQIERYQADFLTVLCKNYPKHLMQIDVPPAVLYYQGNPALFEYQKMLACVGARKAHSYVQDCLTSIVGPLIEDGWVVVSGGAIGADTYAHQVALDNGGKTIAVIGSGLAHLYPARNKKMFQEIVRAGGLVVSSFPMLTMPEARCFPIRNRIVSGLSLGCLVLQAASKSGALITAHFALDQGREVFAVPGPIYDPLSSGCHDLIKQGAKLVVSFQDILDELSCYQEPNLSVLNSNSMQTKSLKKDTCADLLDFDEVDQQLLQKLVVPMSMQELSAKISIDSAQLHAKLFNLSLDGKIEQDCMGLWKRI